MSWKSYDAGQTGADSASSRDEKPAGSTKGCPQRGSRPSLDLSPSNDFGDFSETHLPSGDFYDTHTFKENTDASGVMNDYDDKGAIDNNYPVKVRDGWKVHEHGWQVEPSEALPSGESGGSNKADRSIGSSQKPRTGSSK